MCERRNQGWTYYYLTFAWVGRYWSTPPSRNLRHRRRADWRVLCFLEFSRRNEEFSRRNNHYQQESLGPWTRNAARGSHAVTARKRNDGAKVELHRKCNNNVRNASERQYTKHLSTSTSLTRFSCHLTLFSLPIVSKTQVSHITLQGPLELFK